MRSIPAFSPVSSSSSIRWKLVNPMPVSISPRMIALNSLIPVLLKDKTSWRFIQKGAKRSKVNTTVLGGQDMDHGLQSDVDLARANNFSHITRVGGFQNREVQAFFSEVTLLLSNKKRGVVRIGVPVQKNSSFFGFVYHFSNFHKV